MFDFSRFFNVLFDTERISDDNLNKFTVDHLGRLAGLNAEGQYTAMLAATAAVHEAYFGAVTDEDTATAIRQSLTRSMNAVFEAFQAAVSRQEGTIRGRYGKESGTYQEFFPLGATEYSQATLATIATLMTRFADAARRHLTDLGQPFVDQFTGYKTNFVAARQAQLEKKGVVAGDKGTTASTRDTVERQLMGNLLTIAKDFMGRPAEGMAYFDQSIIQRGGPAATEVAPAPPAPV